MTSFIKNVINHFCSTWEYKAILVYIFMGSFFITYQYAGLNYSELLLSSFTNKIFLVVILYPSFIAMFMNIYQYISKNYSLLLRLNNRNKYAIFCIAIVICITLFLFLEVIVISLINCNITPHEDFSITNNLHYNTNDFVVFIIEVIKILLTILSIGLFQLFLHFSIRKKNIITIILMASLTILFFGDKLYPTGIKVIDYFNPGFQSHGYILINNIMELIISGIIYFPIVYGLLSWGILKSSQKYNIGVN